MTAEIAIMNKTAVALAADSAVTITKSDDPNHHHVYHGVNKLFELTHEHPVAVMVYDSAEFMGIPWETVIKSYRLYLQNDRFERLEQYASHFVSLP